MTAGSERDARSGGLRRLRHNSIVGDSRWRCTRASLRCFPPREPRQAGRAAGRAASLARPVEKRPGTRLDSLGEVARELERHESHLTSTVERLVGKLANINQTVAGLRHDVERITDRLPNPNAGPLEKARDMLIGRSD